jgi:hypothetical protein
LAHEQHHVRCMACGSQNWDGRQVAARGRTTPRGSCSTGCPLAAGARMSCLCTPPWLWGGMLHAPELPPLVDEVYHGSNGHQVAAGRVVVVPRGTQLLPPPLPRTAADAAFVIQAKPPPSHLGHTAEQPSRPPPRRPTTQLPLPSRPGQTAAAAGPNSPAGVMSSSSSFSSLGESTRTIFFSKSFDESWDKIKKRLFHF